MPNNAVFTGFIGTPIEVVVKGPDTVKPGEQFAYIIKVRDFDQVTVQNPRGFDPSTAIYFKINSMVQFKYLLSANPDSEGFFNCTIEGKAKDQPGTYVDWFRGYNRMPGVYWDQPSDVPHAVKIG